MLTLDKEIELRRGDMDSLEHLNNAAYLELMFELRGDLVMKLRTDENRFVVRRFEVDYLHEVRYADGKVSATLKVLELGSSSIVLEQQIVLSDGTVAARARIVLVAWSRSERRARKLTEDERAALGAG